MYDIVNLKFQTSCFLLVFGAFLVGGCAGVVYAQEFDVPPDDPPPCLFCDEPPPVDPKATDTYIPLTPIPGAAPKAGTNLTTYIVGIFRLSVGVAAALAVLMIVVGGVQYMVSEASGGKGAAKERIMAALHGLGLILFALLLLYTIDPTIINPKKSFLPPVIIVRDPATLAKPPSYEYKWKTGAFTTCSGEFGEGWTLTSDIQKCVDNAGPKPEGNFVACCKKPLP